MDLLILFFGANDATIPSDRHSNPLEDYIKDLKYMISLIQDSDSANYSPDTRILMITPPPVGDKMVQALAEYRDIPVSKYKNRTQQYAEAAIEVAKGAGLEYIDLFSELEKAVAKYQNSTGNASKYDGYDHYLIDGVHLNSNGNQVLFDLISQTINSTWPELTPTNITYPYTMDVIPKVHLFDFSP
ncbi:isoamyl acetate-hydrolyzing esterase [Coemansia sp. RSA 1290]|nr:isoamyl acetate-hydrolyzing esterase [Coemansia sp. RSA 1290]